MSGAGHVYYPFAATSYGDSHGYTHQHGTSITPYRERYVNQDHRGSANLTTRPYKQQTSTSLYSKQERVITPEKASYSPVHVRPSTSYAPVKGTSSTPYIPPFEYTPAPLQLSLHDYPVVERRTYTPTETYAPQPVFQRSAPLKTLSDDALAQTIQRPQPHTARSFSSSLGRAGTGTSTFISRPGYSKEQTEAMNNYCKYSLSRRVPESEMKQGYLPGYMGFVRSSQFKHGHTFGKTSRECMDEMPLDRPRI